MTALAPYYKAVVALLTGALAAAFTAMADGVMTPQEWIGVALGALGVTGAVYAVPNRTASLQQALDESVSHEPDA